MIPKELFVETINALQAQYKLDSKNAEFLLEVFPDSWSANLMYNNSELEQALVRLLEHIFNDKAELIQYYLYELDFGKENYRLKATDIDGNDIPLNNPEELYEALKQTYENNLLR